MACYSPISSLNNRIDFRSGVDPVFVTYPCGKCAGCRQTKRNDWFVRLYYEFQRVKRNGCVLFPTFTYNDDSLPYIDLSDEIFSYLDQYVQRPLIAPLKSFDSDTFQKFLKKLRTRLDRLDFPKFKVFTVTEYGSEFTKRPHYHSLFFFDSYVNDYDFRNILEWCWSSEIHINEVPSNMILVTHHYFSKDEVFPLFCPDSRRDKKLYLYCAYLDKYGKIHYYKKRGNVRYSDDFGAYVKDSNSLDYVTKYLAKDSNYMSDPGVKSFVEYLDQLPPASKVPKLHGILITKLRDVLPFWRASKEIGIELFDDLKLRSELNLQKDVILNNNLLPNKINVEGNFYKIPTYITDKLFYEEKEIVRYYHSNFYGRDIFDYKLCKKRYLTKLGKEVLALRYERKVDEMRAEYELYKKPEFIKLLKSFAYDVKSLNLFNNIQQMVIPFVDFELLAYYKLSLQNVRLTDDYMFYQYDKEDFISYCLDMYNFKLDSYDEVSDYFEAPTHSYNFEVGCLFNHLPIFEGFDLYLQYVDKIKYYISLCRQFNKDKREYIGKQLTDYLNFLKYGF